jgi:hypothetical protein
MSVLLELDDASTLVLKIVSSMTQLAVLPDTSAACICTVRTMRVDDVSSTDMFVVTGTPGGPSLMSANVTLSSRSLSLTCSAIQDMTNVAPVGSVCLLCLAQCKHRRLRIYDDHAESTTTRFTLCTPR